MNIKQAKERFTLESLLAILGFLPDKKKSKGHDLWYFSPFRPDERTPSFHIDTRRNFFKDFGDTDKGGDLIWFAQTYLKNQGKDNGVPQALKWLERLGSTPAPSGFNQIARPALAKQEIKEPYKIITDKEIYSTALFDYLKERKIPVALAKSYLRQIYFLHRESGNKIFGLGFKTRAGGYDIRNPKGFKTMIGGKDITIIRGINNSVQIEVFEGVMDFLSQLSIREKMKPDNDTIILNSANLYDKGCQFIKDGIYLKTLLWRDNDRAGQNLTHAFKEQFGQFKNRDINVEDMAPIYEPFKDLNEWHKNAALAIEKKREIIETLHIVSRNQPDNYSPNFGSR